MRLAHRRLSVLHALATWLWCGVAWAAGTPSGTTVSNVATLQFVQAGSSLQITSNVASFRIDEVLNVVVQKSDAGQVAVASPDTRRAMSFTVTNTGNGAQKFVLAADAALTSDQFDPSLVKVVIDSNGNGLYDPDTDREYLSGQSDPLLIAPDQSLTVFLVSDIPGERANGDVGLVSLTARDALGTGAPGTTFAGKGAGGSDAVVGATRAIAVAQNGYLVSQVRPVLTKSQTVVNPSGGAAPLPGSTVTYSLRLELKGSGSVVGGRIVDAIPANSSYVAGSLKLDDAVLTDQSDADAGRFVGNGIEVTLGSLVAPVTHVVSFQVRLN